MSYIGQISGKTSIEEYTQEANKTAATEENNTVITQEGENDEVVLSDEILETLNNYSSELKDISDSDSTDVSSILSRIQALKSNISVYTSQISYLDEQIELKQTQIDEITEKLEEVQKEYDEIEKELEDKQTELEEKNSEIKKINKQIEKQKEIIENSTSEDEIQAASSKLSTYYNKLSTLYNEKSSLEEKISALNTELQSKANTISQYQTQISTLEDSVTALSSQRSEINNQKTAAEEELKQSMLSVVSEAEWQLVEDNNIDLTEKLENGEPRYIFAQGKSDNLYHIYDMAANSSLARIYGENGGYDIISSGNGNISSFTKTGDGSGSSVFYMEECGSVSEFNACYSTCSPLSFDINGDGVKTSNSVINYDIDGDGTLDKINDSADAVLVFDKDGNGISGEDGSECFGNNTDLDGDNIKDGFANGFEALKELAKQNNLINGKDDNVLDSNDLAYLEENFGLKLKLNGYESEAVSLKDAGITEINLSTTDETTLIDNFDGQGNQLMQQQGATFTINGETREYADIWHKKILSDVEKTADIFSGDSLSFSIGASLNYNNFFSTLRTTDSSSSSDNKEGLKEIKEAQKTAREKIKDIKEEHNK